MNIQTYVDIKIFLEYILRKLNTILVILYESTADIVIRQIP